MRAGVVGSRGLPGVRVWFLNTSSEYWRQPFVFCMQAGQVRPVPARVTRRCVSQFPMSHSIGLQRSREGLNNAGSNMNAENGVCVNNQSVKSTPNYALANAKLPNANTCIASLVSHTRTFFVTKNRRPPEHRTRLVCLGVSPSPPG